MLIVGHCYGIRSERQLCQEVELRPKLPMRPLFKQHRPNSDMLLRRVHALRVAAQLPGIAISTLTANTGIAATTNTSRPRNLTLAVHRR
jgi:hypothetical protein